MVFEIRSYSRRRITRQSKVIAETSTRGNDCLACHFRGGDCCTRDDLGCSNGCDIWASARERGVESISSSGSIKPSAGAAFECAASAAVACNAIIAAANHDSDVLKAKLHVLYLRLEISYLLSLTAHQLTRYIVSSYKQQVNCLLWPRKKRL